MTPLLYIPFKKFRSVGGPSSFMNNLKEYLDAVGYGYSEFVWKSRTIFFPMGYPLRYLKLLKLAGWKVIQRLDGVYYFSKHGQAFKKFNRLQEIIFKKYADYVIFQSEHSKQQVFEMFGEIPKEKYSIIYNGANKNIFYPAKGKEELSGRIKFVTTGSFRNLDMIEPIVLALDKLKADFNFELHTVGPVTNPGLKCFFERDYIVNHGSVDLQSVSEILRDSDIFIYSHLNPPCPNSVIEAISCGLPVVSFDSGSMKELCSFSKDLLAEVNNEVFQKYEDFDYNKLAEKIELAVTAYNKYKQISMENAQNFPFEKCGNNYIDVFRQI